MLCIKIRPPDLNQDMPEESLPYKQKQPEPTKAPPPSSQSPNLLDAKLYQPQSPLDFKNYDASSFLVVLKVLIILTQAVFFILLGIHSLKASEIQKLRTELTKLTKSADYQQSIESETQATIRQIQLYKQAMEAKMPLHPQTKLLMETRIPGIEITELTITGKTAALKITVSAPLDMTRLITGYLKTETVDAIIIQGARLNTTKKIFYTDLEIWFK